MNGDRERSRWIGQLGFELESPRWLEELKVALEQPPNGQLNGYELVEELKGGQAVVYRGQCATGQVAIKRLRAPGLLDHTARQRFQREIEVVSSLRHPGIVGVLEVADTGEHPLLVMEWIDGLPATEWVAPDGARRSTSEILSLFQKICEALLFAHQNGVIHRDLKPSNILVDETGNPHLLDFGLAKLVDVGAHNATLTNEGEFVGTLGYCSPEQLVADEGTVDSRTDIYSLGVLLFECLTGEMPYRLGPSITATIQTVLTGTSRKPSQLDPNLDRQLDAIVDKALAKAPGDRYQSVDAFSEDLLRYQRGAPLLARERSTWDTLKRQARFHRGPLLGGLLLLLLLMGFGATMAVFQHRSSEALARSERVQAFLERAITGYSDPGAPPNVPGLLAGAAARIEQEFVDNPDVALRIRNRLAERYMQLSMWPEVAEQGEAALALADRISDREELELVWSRHHLGLARVLMNDPEGFGDLATAQSEYRRLLGDEHPRVAQVDASTGTGYLFCAGSRSLEQAEFHLARSLQTFERSDQQASLEPASVLRFLGILRQRQGRFEEGILLFRRALADCEAMGAQNHTVAIASLEGIGQALSSLGRFEEATEYLLQAIASRQGGSDDMLPACYANLATAYTRLARFDEALARYHQAIAARCRRLAEKYPTHRASLDVLAARILSSGLEPEDVAQLRDAFAATEPYVLNLLRFTADRIVAVQERRGEKAAAAELRGALLAALP